MVAPKPTLVVLITVDQMRRDYFERWKGQLTAGLKRLGNGGAFFTDAHQDHAITETAPGHASLLSGRFPRSTGITRNVAGVNDNNSQLLGGAPGSGASPFRFRGTELFDWMAKVTPESRALSVSYKDRGAILPVGRSKQQVYWYSINGMYTTSTWYRDTLPDWVIAFNNRKLPQSYAGKVWDLLLPASAYAEPDSVPLEARGAGFMFPHRLPGPDTVTRILPGTPFMDEVSVALALDGVNQLGLGKGPAPDLLAVSLSATDLIGHGYGSDSREIHDQILRLDRTIGMFIDSLFKLRDSNQVAIVLSADHGAQPFPELNNGRINPAPVRVDIRPAIAVLQKMITDSGGSVRAFDFESGALFLDQDSVKVSRRWANIAVDSFLATARRTPGVARAERLSVLARKDLGKDMIARRWVQMFPPDVPVVATITMTPGSYWWNVSYATHGTPNLQDSNVPIVFYGPWFKPGSYGQFVRTVDIAPTLAQVLGITPLEPIDGRVLKAAIR
jgi:predicted AlkP superfamily pyrophosphatase or phosphodiesterase